MAMETYPIALKKFMKFTKTKSVTLAEHIGYDVSYISKWINGAKLPSSRNIERINEDAAALFTDIIQHQARQADCCRYFAFSATVDDLSLAISNYLNEAYRTSLRSQHREKETPSKQTNIILSHQNVSQFLKNLFRKKFPTLKGKERLIIYGEFFDFYDDGFWNYLDVPLLCQRMRVSIGLDKEKLRKHPEYIARLYTVLNRFPDMEFTFYDFSLLSDANLIILKDQFVVSYSLQSHRGMMMCSYIDDPAIVHDIYERFSVHHTPRLMTHVQSPWDSDSGYRTSFYETSHFCFFLTNGIEYLLPEHVFDRLIQESSHERARNIERLRITWEEIIAKARVSLIVPTPSLMRYMETGYIDLTDRQYKLTPLERISHLQAIANILKQNTRITLSTLHLAPSFLSYKEANLSFYSNYKTSFFKKNTLAMHSQADSFYIIVDRELHTLILEFMAKLLEAPYCHRCSGETLENKLPLYQNILEKITTISKESHKK